MPGEERGVQSPVPIAVYLTIVVLFSLSAILWLWPGTLVVDGRTATANLTLPDDATVVIPFAAGEFQMDVHRDLYLLAILGGVLGSCIYCIHALLPYLVDERYSASWASWYVLNPVLGAAVGLAAAVVLRGIGNLVDPIVNLPTTPIAPLAIGVLAGVSTKHSVRWLRDQSKRIFTKGLPARVEDATVTPEGTVDVVGRGLDRNVTVLVDGVKTEIKKADADRVSVALPQGSQPRRIEVQQRGVPTFVKQLR